MRQIIADFGTLHILGWELPLRIFGYGLMLVLGFITAILLAQWRAKREGLNPQIISQVGILSLLGGVVGARLAYILTNWDSFAGKGIFEIFNLTSGGLIYYGGLIGGTLAVLAYIALKRLPMRRVIDIVAPSLMIGLAAGRCGCTLNGCCWGGPVRADWPVAIRFPMVSRPLLKIGGDGPYATGQSMCPAYSHQYFCGRVHPDERLLNAFVSVEQSGSGGKHRISGVIPPDQLHGLLGGGQLATMWSEKPTAERLFLTSAGADGMMDRHEWDSDRKTADGFLRGSEIWDEAVAFASQQSVNLRGEQRLNFDEAWEYLQARKRLLLAKFDTDGNGRLSDEQRSEANAYLQADLFAVLAAQRSNPLHPAQPMGIINALLIAALLSAFYRHRRREGRVFALMLILYPITRFILESIRSDDPLNVLSGNLTHSQICSIVLLAAGALLWWWTGRRTVFRRPAADG